MTGVDRVMPLHVVLRALQRVAFVAALSVIAGVGIGLVTGRLTSGAAFIALCFFCGLVGFLPFRTDIAGELHAKARFLLLMGVSLTVLIAYVLAIAVMGFVDSSSLASFSNPSHPYIFVPACFYVVVVGTTTISLALSRRR